MAQDCSRFADIVVQCVEVLIRRVSFIVLLRRFIWALGLVAVNRFHVTTRTSSSTGFEQKLGRGGGIHVCDVVVAIVSLVVAAALIHGKCLLTHKRDKLCASEPVLIVNCRRRFHRLFSAFFSAQFSGLVPSLVGLVISFTDSCLLLFGCSKRCLLSGPSLDEIACVLLAGFDIKERLGCLCVQIFSLCSRFVSGSVSPSRSTDKGQDGRDAGHMANRIPEKERIIRRRSPSCH